MPKAYLTTQENILLHLRGHVFAGGYLYKREEFCFFVRVRRIKEEFLGTSASKDYKSSENPDGWERVKIIVGGTCND